MRSAALHRLLVLLVSVFVLALPSTARGDKKGCTDPALFPVRMPNYEIGACQTSAFEGYDFYTGQRQKHREEGKLTFITYQLVRGQTEASGIEVVRNYENAFRKLGGTIVATDPKGNWWTNGKVTIDGKEVWFQVEKGNGKIAFSDKGDVVATSEIQSFTYAPPAGGSLPPRAPRHSPPALACSKLIPEALANQLLPGFAMEESTPCGAALSGGCPLTCGFARRDDKGTQRVSLTFACSESQWDRYPKPKQSVPLAGVGRAAQIVTKDDDTTILFHSTSTKCIVKQRREMPRDASISLAKAIDAQLVPGSMWMPDDWR